MNLRAGCGNRRARAVLPILVLVALPDRYGEAIIRVVGHTNDVFFFVKRDDRLDWPENFVTGEEVTVADIIKNRRLESPLVCRRPRSKDVGLWKRTNVETDTHLVCVSVLCGWCSNIRVNLTANLLRSNRLRPRSVVGLIRFGPGSGELKRTAVDVMA